METREQVAERLEAHRVAAGVGGKPLAFRKIAQAVYDGLGDEAPTEETIRAYHRGTGPQPESMNIDLMVELAILYRCELHELSVTVLDRAIRRRTRHLAALPSSNTTSGNTPGPRGPTRRSDQHAEAA